MIKTIEQRATELEQLIASHEINPERIQFLEEQWQSDPRWKGVTRAYSVEDMLRFRGTLKVE